MDIFQHRYYRLGKILMSLTGQWPYQSIHARRGIIGALVLFSAYDVIDQPLTVVKYRDDWNILIQCFIPFLFEAVTAVKFFSFMCNSPKILKLLDRIRTDWQVWARHQEVKTLHEYAERGEKITVMYTAVFYSVTVVFKIEPMITKLIDVTLNGTEPGKFSIPVVYEHLDIQKYYYYLIVYGAASALVLLTVLVSSEVMLILYVQHVCGIFAAVGHKLERLGSNDTSVKTGESPYALDKTDRVYLTSCIERHSDAIEYANLISATYVWDLFFNIFFGVIIINTTGIQIFMRTDDIGATLTFMSLALGTLLNFYVECCIAQILIDHSISIRFYIYNSQWYRLPPMSQKILQLMTLRCNTPSQLTAGKIFILSVQFFALTTRTIISFLTFIRSTQGL